MDILQELKIHQMLNNKLSHKLSEIGYQLCLALGDEIHKVNYWDLIQQLSAHLAGLKEFEKAKILLQLGKDHSAFERPSFSWAVGWAWRAVTFHRLQQLEKSQHAIDWAYKGANEEVPMSRSWNEWEDILISQILIGDWQAAFLATSQPKSEMVCFNLKCKALSLWEWRK